MTMLCMHVAREYRSSQGCGIRDSPGFFTLSLHVLSLNCELLFVQEECSLVYFYCSETSDKIDVVNCEAGQEFMVLSKPLTTHQPGYFFFLSQLNGCNHWGGVCVVSRHGYLVSLK